mgnify:CR=1 FL=1
MYRTRERGLSEIFPNPGANRAKRRAPRRVP